MKKIFILLAFASILPLFAAFPIAKNGAAECVLVYPDSPELWEGKNILPREMAYYLQKITGTEFKAVRESEFSGNRPAVFLGNTKAAANAGLTRKVMNKRDWTILCNDKSLYLFGGSLTADMYAMYYFLETYLKVRFLSPEAETIPQNKNISIPAFRKDQKYVFTSYWNFHGMFRNATKINPSGEKGMELIKLYEFKHRSGERYQDSTYIRKHSRKTGLCHSFYRYVPPAKFFKTKPEFFSVTPEGKRAYLPNGQLCLSNDELCELVTKQLLEWIEEDKAKNPTNYALVYSFSQEDCADFFCYCKKCQEISKKYGADSGLQLEFLNKVARVIGKKHPEIALLTFAYMHSEKPPKGIKPEPNVIVWFADLYVRSNRLKPLTDPVNATQLGYLKGWCELSPNMAVWDYHNMLTGDQPEICIDAIASDIRTFRDLGVKHVMNECEIGESRYSLRPQTFIWLQYYVMYKLQENPDRDLEEIVNEFMDAYYEDAAPEMKEYLALLRNAIKTHKFTAADIHSKYFPYITADFLKKSEALLKKALTKTASKKVQRRIKDELAVVSYTWIKFLNNTPQKGMTVDQYVKEYTSCIRDHIADTDLLTERFKKAAKEFLQNDEIYSMQLKFNDLPRKYANYKPDTLKLFATNCLSAYRDTSKIINDPESSVGKAAVFQPKNTKFHKIPIKMGMFDGSTKRQMAVSVSDIPQDEKYHWIKIGTFKIGTSTKIWLTEFWHITMILRNTFISSDGLKDDENPNVYEIWVSLKFQGPAYVKGSAKPNAVFFDRAFLARRKQGSQETFSDLPGEITEQMKGNVICFGTKALIAHRSTSQVKTDVDSYLAEAAVFQPKDQTLHKMPARMGLYDSKSKRQKTISLKTLPADEKYHWVDLGEFEIGENTQIWATSTWHLGVRLKDSAIKPGCYRIWVSAKYQGPAYIKGSKMPNRVSVDRACMIPVTK
jgi:hypothetical protein